MSYAAWGPNVLRPPNATAATIVTAGTRTVFTITGHLRNVFLVGRVNTVIGAGVTSIRVSINATTGATDSDLCADTVITSFTAGKLLGLSGVPTDQLLFGAGEGHAPYGSNPIVLAPGIVQVVCTGGTTGDIIWGLSWDPWSLDAFVTP